MQKLTVALAALALFSFAAYRDAEAAGCLKGGAIGGVAGHEVGSGHAVAGAAAGCAIGHHEASKKNKKAAQQNQSNGTRDGAGSSAQPTNGDGSGSKDQ